MDEDDYDILPHKEIINLKKEIEELKRRITGSKNVKTSIENLADSINNLTELLELAKKEMEGGGGEEHIILKQIEPLTNKIDTIIEQNEKIAEGIVAIADMIRELKVKPIIKPVRVEPQFEYNKPKMPQPVQLPKGQFYPPPPFMPSENLNEEPLSPPEPLPGFEDSSRKRLFGMLNK